MLQNSFRRHRPQIKLQTTRKHGRWHLLGVGGGQYKLEVRRRLFQRLEHGVESRVREHVNLVDHEDLEASDHRLVNRLLEQLRNLVHTPVGSSVELGVVDKTAAVDVHACLANAARRGRNVALPVGPGAVERLGQNTRHRGLANPARAGEQISVVQALRAQRIAQCLDHMRLPDHLRKILGAVFAGKYKVRHGPILECSLGSASQDPGYAHSKVASTTINTDGPSRMVKRPTGSGGEPSSPNCGASAGARLVTFFFRAFGLSPRTALSDPAADATALQWPLSNSRRAGRFARSSRPAKPADRCR